MSRGRAAGEKINPHQQQHITHTLHTTAEERIVDKNKLIGMIHTNEIGFYTVNNVITYRWGEKDIYSAVKLL